MKTGLDIVREMYSSEFMTLTSEDYDKESSVFGFIPKEPPVTKQPIDYLTPRGTHLFISQGAYCLVENLIREGKIEFTANELRDLYFKLRLQLTDFGVKMRRPISLDKLVQGKLSLKKFRPGKLPVIVINYDIGNKSFRGTTLGTISSYPTATNTGALRA